ncbi:hypothetical protein [Pseudoglutamicibacter albus]|uniref:DUF4298 domain-containing protein n=1 Tax=Pseudoglutamicibacter albus DNF00011 TaxID=1401063 RepID=A0A095ZLF7_9MICC|nr:hypothetical protein [Pseudoglutamicibacter albus]KGF19442.1 hypothetical protein HMPREF2128_10200 [Pseudoglutamicibacter albus DNF00011]
MSENNTAPFADEPSAAASFDSAPSGAATFDSVPGDAGATGVGSSQPTPEQRASLKRLSVAQENLVRARAAYVKAAEGLRAIEAFSVAMEPLMDYYDNGWLADVNATESIYERPEAAGEDEIWNMHGNQYELMRELLAISSNFFVRVPGQES